MTTVDLADWLPSDWKDAFYLPTPIGVVGLAAAI